MAAPDEVSKLVRRFQDGLAEFRSTTYKEARVRLDFINPLFAALGWDISNQSGKPEAKRDVITEFAQRIGGTVKAPDYCFRIGGENCFFVEAKQPSINIANAPGPAFQLRIYGWSANLPVSILTDFEEFAVYDCRVLPVANDKAATARPFYFRYDEYLSKWDEIEQLFSYEAVLNGSLEQFASQKVPRNATPVDVAFLKEIEGWRAELARNVAINNPQLSVASLNYAVQMTLDRIIFLRICEERNVEPGGQLLGLTNAGAIYDRMRQLFRRADARYNSGLFHFDEEQGREEPDDLTLSLKIDDTPLRNIITHLYYPTSPYIFNVIPVEILGQVYEQFLGRVITVSGNGAGRKIEVEEKPEVRKAGGVFYTPKYIVDYNVEHTVGELLKHKTPRQAASLKIIDPACGSGSFLLGAYGYLLDWHLHWYIGHEPHKHRKEVYQVSKDEWRLTTEEKKRILRNNIYGVDIDQQAVEVTKLSLLLKVLEGETDQSIAQQLGFFRERALPDLSDNIKCGNSLIGPDFYTSNQQMNFLPDEEQLSINVFDWSGSDGFPNIIQAGGFDVVIGNPPYIDSEWMTTYRPRWRSYCADRYEAASGNWDIFCVFIEKAIELCKPSGLTSLIVPNKLGSAEYARGARTLLGKKNRILSVRDYSRVPVFPVSVYPIIYVAKKITPSMESMVHYERMEVVNGVIQRSQEHELNYSDYFMQPEQPWRIFSSIQDAGLVERMLKDFPPLKSVAQVLGAATVSEAYELQPLMSEHMENDTTQLKVINSGTIDRYHILWGEKPIRYLGNSYLRPVVASRSLDKLPRKRRQQSEQPKIVIAGMTKALECVADIQGEILAAKSTSIVLARFDLRYLLGVLNSRLINFYFVSVFGGNSLQGGYLRIGPPQLERIPIRTLDLSKPEEKAQHEQMVALVERMLALHQRLADAHTAPERTPLQRQIEATDKEIDRLVYELYSLTDEEIKIVEAAKS